MRSEPWMAYWAAFSPAGPAPTTMTSQMAVPVAVMGATLDLPASPPYLAAAGVMDL